MNKIQKNAIAENLSLLLHKIEKCEERLEVAQDNRDTDAIVKISARLNVLSAELQGADIVLTILGYTRKYHDDNNYGHYTLEKL